MMYRLALCLLAARGALAQLTVPGAPAAAELSVLSGESARLEWDAPLSDGGEAVKYYQVEWDTSGGTQELQAMTTTVSVGANELQTVTTTATDVDEVQEVSTRGEGLMEVQEITTSATAATSCRWPPSSI